MASSPWAHRPLTSRFHLASAEMAWQPIHSGWLRHHLTPSSRLAFACLHLWLKPHNNAPHDTGPRPCLYTPPFALQSGALGMPARYHSAVLLKGANGTHGQRSRYNPPLLRRWAPTFPFARSVTSYVCLNSASAHVPTTHHPHHLPITSRRPPLHLPPLRTSTRATLIHHPSMLLSPSALLFSTFKLALAPWRLPISVLFAPEQPSS